MLGGEHASHDLGLNFNIWRQQKDPKRIKLEFFYKKKLTFEHRQREIFGRTQEEIIKKSR
jgi:hypothetical protein